MHFPSCSNIAPKLSESCLKFFDNSTASSNELPSLKNEVVKLEEKSIFPKDEHANSPIKKIETPEKLHSSSNDEIFFIDWWKR